MKVTMTSNIIHHLKARYHAREVDLEQCEPYLRNGQTVLFGLRLPDKKSNYHLLTTGDLRSLSKADRDHCIRTSQSPFDNLLLIVYRNCDDTISFKLINGMASKLVEEMVLLCEHSEFFRGLDG